MFVYDHLWRGDPPNRRPALECFALLGAVAAETSRVQVGTLVARATLRPPATLANAFATAQRVSGGRLIAGDRRGRLAEPGRERGVRSRVRHDGRPRRPRCTTRCARRAGNGYPVWVGGRAAQVREIVADRRRLELVGRRARACSPSRRALVREVAPDATLTWGGLARPLEEGAAALADRLRPYVDARRDVDHRRARSTRAIPTNAAVLGDVRARLDRLSDASSASAEQELGRATRGCRPSRRRVQAVAPERELREPDRAEHAHDVVEVGERRAVAVAVDDVDDDRAQRRR